MSRGDEQIIAPLFETDSRRPLTERSGIFAGNQMFKLPNSNGGAVYSYDSVELRFNLYHLHNVIGFAMFNRGRAIAISNCEDDSLLETKVEVKLLGRNKTNGIEILLFEKDFLIDEIQDWQGWKFFVLQRSGIVDEVNVCVRRHNDALSGNGSLMDLLDIASPPNVEIYSDQGETFRQRVQRFARSAVGRILAALILTISIIYPCRYILFDKNEGLRTLPFIHILSTMLLLVISVVFGFLVGFFGVFTGAMLRRRNGPEGAAFGFVPLLTSPAASVISFLATSICLLVTQQVYDAMIACAVVNVVLFVALIAWAMLA